MPRSARARVDASRNAAAALAVLLVTLAPAWLPGSWRPAPAQIGPRREAAQSADRCVGLDIPAGADLAAVMTENPPGTTYCLAAGTFEVDRTIPTQAGDRIIGAGRDSTHIDGTRLPPTSPGIFAIGGASHFEALDVFGAPTPAVDGGATCSPSSNCGKAFNVSGNALTLRSVNCHDNGGNCVGGGGAATVIVDDLDCWGNGSAYSMTREFRYAACVKRAAIYESSGDTIVTNSHIHDNAWVGLWCDFCKYGDFAVENNRIVRNGSNGVQWEMSGGWTGYDAAIVRGNVIQDNNRLGSDDAGGVAISTANDITVESNRFGGNTGRAVSIIFTPSRHPPQSDTWGVVVRDNVLNGDAVIGCGRVPLPKRLYLERAKLALAGAVGGVVLLVAIVLHWRRRVHFGLALGAGGVVAAGIAVWVAVQLSRSAALCLNNA